MSTGVDEKVQRPEAVGFVAAVFAALAFGALVATVLALARRGFHIDLTFLAVFIARGIWRGSARWRIVALVFGWLYLLVNVWELWSMFAQPSEDFQFFIFVMRGNAAASGIAETFVVASWVATLSCLHSRAMRDWSRAKTAAPI